MEEKSGGAGDGAAPGRGLFARLAVIRDWIGRKIGRRLVISLSLLAVIGVTETSARRYGDNLQIALPILALGCEIVNGRGLDYAGRYAVMFLGVHGTKRSLGETELNARPNGGTHGFPSGHTATAAFGASSLVQRCITGSPVVQSGVIIAAAFVGTSRVDADAHTIWQVLVGGIWGVMCDQGFRRGSASRRRLGALFSGLRGLFTGKAAVAAGDATADPIAKQADAWQSTSHQPPGARQGRPEDPPV